MIDVLNFLSDFLFDTFTPSIVILDTASTLALVALADEEAFVDFSSSFCMET